MFFDRQVPLEEGAEPLELLTGQRPLRDCAAKDPKPKETTALQPDYLQRPKERHIKQELCRVSIYLKKSVL